MALNVPCVNPFDCEIGTRETNVGVKWDKLVMRFENYILAVNIESDDRKKAMLLHTVGPKTHDTFLSLPDQGTTYDEAKRALTNYFKPKVSLEYEKAVF